MDFFTKTEADEVFNYLTTGDDRCGKEADYKLYCLLMNEMLYGVAKARTGTPHDWYFDYFRGYTDDELRAWINNRLDRKYK